MTDIEIIKALEICSKGICRECPRLANDKCFVQLSEYSLSLINRQNAEIDRLQGAVQEWVDGKCLSQNHLLMIGKLQNEIETAKAKAIKEFAERFKSIAGIYQKDTYVIGVDEFDNLVKEMVGDLNES